MLTTGTIELDEMAEKARRLASGFPGRTFYVIRTPATGTLHIVTEGEEEQLSLAGKAYRIVSAVTQEAGK